MPGRYRYSVPGVGGTVRCGRSRFGADCEARPPSGIALRSAQDRTSTVSTAESITGACRADRTPDRNVRAPVDVPAAGNVRFERVGLVGASDTRRTGSTL